MDRNKRFYSLDLLKFILSVVIVFHHFQQSVPVRFRYFNFYNGLINFAYCVEMFFIISGFLSAMQKEKIQDRTFCEYITGKIRRFYPMAALSVIVLIFTGIIYYFINGSWADGLVPDLYKTLNSLLLTFKGGSVLCGRGINNPLWFVSVLMICYVFLWILLYISKKHEIPFIYLAIVMCTIGVGINDYGINLPFMNEYTARGYAAFFLGMILCEIYQRADQKKLSVMSGIILLVSGILAILDYASFYQYEWGAYTFVVLPCLLFAVLAFECLCRFESVRKLGGASFEIYLWHSLFLSVLGILYSFPEIKAYLECINGIVYMGVFAILVVLFSLIMHICFEKKIDDFMASQFRALFNGRR